MNPSDHIRNAAKRATLKWMADDKVQRLAKKGMDHMKLAEAIADRLRLENPAQQRVMP